MCAKDMKKKDPEKCLKSLETVLRIGLIRFVFKS